MQLGEETETLDILPRNGRWNGEEKERLGETKNSEYKQRREKELKFVSVNLLKHFCQLDQSGPIKIYSFFFLKELL